MSRRPRDADEEELEDLVGELAGTLEALRGTLDDGARRATAGTEASGPSPPRPFEVVRFTEQYTIPAIISVLEASIRSLELLRGALRLADGRPEATERERGSGRDDERAERALGAVDGLLDDLQRTVEGRPVEPEARDLLTDAQSLREEIGDRIAGGPGPATSEGGRGTDAGAATDRTDGRDGAVRIAVSEGDDGDRSGTNEGRPDGRDDERTDEERTAVDVEAELDAIRREVRGEEAAADGEHADEDRTTDDDSRS